MTRADKILKDVYKKLGISDKSDVVKYENLDKIIQLLQAINNASPINPKTTGTITERLCELAIRSEMGGDYSRMPGEWQWLADYSLYGVPFNVIVSVKSFKVKERLMASGSGSLLTPTIAWTLADDYREFGESRTRSYVYAGFIAIYMPAKTLVKVSSDARKVMNVNGKPLLRDVSDFIKDMSSAKNHNRIDIRKY